MKNKYFEFNYYYEWTTFKIGLGFGRVNDIGNWKYMIDLDITFISFWIYFGKK